MFKKLANLFFEDVEVDEENIQADKVEPKEKTKADKPKPKTNVEPTNEPIKFQPKAEEKTEVVKSFEKKKEKSIFINNTTETPVVKEPPKKVEEPPAKYEFSPIISPIRGVKVSDKNEYEVNKSKREHKTVKRSQLGTIISPIFGHGKGLNQVEVEEVIEELENEAQPSNNEFTNYSLAELIDEKSEVNPKTKVHYFIGIKGTGMAALANLLIASGYKVAGSDTSDYVFTEEELLNKGVKIDDFGANSIQDEMVVIVGNSFYDDHVDVIAAKSNPTVKTYTYPQFLGKFIEDYTSVAVSGSHGKTTTTSMISDMLSVAMPVAHLIGDGRGAAFEDAKTIVIEACEYKRNFLNYPADFGIITNVEWDHVDYYKTFDDYLLAFEEFSAQIKNTVLIFGDDENARRLNIDNKVVYYGENENNDLYATNIIETSAYSSFDVVYLNENLGNFKISKTGRHMIHNALASIGIGLLLNVDVELIKEGLLNYQGAKRRFDVDEIGDSVVIDDYAHHPTELKVTLEAARTKYPNHKLVAVYHPDRIKRLETFFDDFVVALKLADQSVIGSAVDSDGMSKEIDTSALLANLDNAFVVDDDEASVSKLAHLSPAVYVFMGTKEMHHLKLGLIDYLKRIDF